MKLFAWRPFIVATFALVIVASTAHAQSVTFTSLRDAVPEKFFDAATSVADPANPNRLIINFNSGFDLTTFTFNGFAATTGPFGLSSAMDTVSFDIVVPEDCIGCYVASVTYTQKGVGTVLRSGTAQGAASWMVADVPAQLGFFGSDPTLTGTVDVSALQLRTVPVAITASLFAWSSPRFGFASTMITDAEVVVEIVRPE
jgi:hypothetical protein